MALINVGQIVKRIQVMLDDSAGRRFNTAYILPYLDQENESYEVSLERLGVQQQEQIAIIKIPAAVSGADGSTPPVDLAPYFAAGQPLANLVRPKRLDWKIQGQPDTSYTQAADVNELDDVTLGNLGVQQYRWANGSIQITPSFTPVTIRVYYIALVLNLTDPSSTVMRGIGFILARQTALVIASGNNNMGKLAERLQKDLARDKQNFSNLIVMQGQASNVFPRGTKRGQAVNISAGGKAYL